MSKCLTCGKNGSFGVPGTKKPLHCKEHKQDGEVNVKHAMCVLCDTQKRATFKDDNGSLKWCSAHAPEDSQSTAKKCIVCNVVVANFGPRGGKKMRCKTCSIAGDIYLGSGLCKTCKSVTASFGKKGDKTGTRCSACRLPSDIHVRLKRCEVCEVMANFGSEDDFVPRRCATHKQEGDADVRSKRCETCNKRRAMYGDRGGIPRFCSDCKSDSHINPRSRLCSTCQLVMPSYGPAESDHAERCATCRESDDVKISTSLCIVCREKYASFGNPDEGGSAKFCNDCKGPDDVNVCKTKCFDCGVRRARFGVFTKERCGQCKRPGDLNLYCTLCAVCNETIPSFGQPSDDNPKRCFECKIPGDVSKTPRCVECKEHQKKRDGYCGTCHPDYVPTASGCSLKACQFIDSLEKEWGVSIRHSHFDGEQWRRDEYASPEVGLQWRVDGYITPLAANNGAAIVIEYEGDEWHGHPRMWKDDRNARNHVKALYVDLYNQAQQKLRRYLQSGYRVYYVWESEDDRRKRAGGTAASALKEFNGALYPRPHHEEPSKRTKISE